MEDELERARRAKTERDDLEFVADMRNARKHRIRSALEGLPGYTLAQVYSDFIGVLRSGEEIEQSLRDTIADALQRGLHKEDGVRLRVEADESFFKAADSLAADDRLLEAGLHFSVERRKIVNGKPRLVSTIYKELPALSDKKNLDEFGLNVRDINEVGDFGRRARDILEQFQSWLKMYYPELVGFELLAPDRRDAEAEDDFAMAKSEFLLKRHSMWADEEDDL